MNESPVIKTLDEMLAKLKDAVQASNEAQTLIREYTNAIRALAQVCEDEEIKAQYHVALDEISGKPGFLDAIRSVLRSNSRGLTPAEITAWMNAQKNLNLLQYTDPVASINTTLRRMVESGEVVTAQNASGEQAYRMTGKAWSTHQNLRLQSQSIGLPRRPPHKYTVPALIG
jgi:hypothetical protein